jgi:ferredoxin
MTEAEKKEVIRRLEEIYLRKYGKKFQISTQPAESGALWGYGLDLSRCIGCRRCVYACVKENNQSRVNPQLQWIRVIRLKKGSLINLENAEHYYNPETVPEGAGWHRGGRLQLVHRLPLLHCGLPLQGTGLQLGRAQHPRGRVEYGRPLSGEPAPNEKCRGKMHVLCPAGPERALPCLR